MNKRIKELVGQAVEETNKIVYHEDYPQWNDTFHQKFAELIVRECADIDFYKLAGIGTIDDDNVTQVIKQHFGVE